MSSKDAHLYGVPRPKKQSSQPTNSQTSSFGTALSSLISAESRKPSQPRPKPSAQPRDRDDIFKSHNRGSKKRAAADMLGMEQKHSTTSEALDASAWQRSKRKMDEKARLYNALKRGDVEDTNAKYGVDFDKKWADREGAELSEQSDDDDGDADSDMEGRVARLKEEVTYTDSFGRLRKMTRAEMQRQERAAARAQRAAAALTEDQARPAAPSNIIYGDAIQHSAFNPDEDAAQRMAALAADRDREATPPKDTHYDATAEVRTRGTGFFQFSADEAERRRQMEELETRRGETEDARGTESDAKEAMRRRREQELEARRQLVREKKGKAKGNRFLDELGSELQFKLGDGQ